MPEERKDKSDVKKDIEKIEKEVVELQSTIKEIQKRLEGNLTLPLFGKIALGFFGVLLSLWSLVWFGLQTHIKNELLEYRASQDKILYEMMLDKQSLKGRLEILEKRE